MQFDDLFESHGRNRHKVLLFAEHTDFIPFSAPSYNSIWKIVSGTTFTQP